MAANPLDLADKRSPAAEPGDYAAVAEFILRIIEEIR